MTTWKQQLSPMQRGALCSVVRDGTQEAYRNMNEPEMQAVRKQMALLAFMEKHTSNPKFREMYDAFASVDLMSMYTTLAGLPEVPKPVQNVYQKPEVLALAGD